MKYLINENQLGKQYIDEETIIALVSKVLSELDNVGTKTTVIQNIKKAIGYPTLPAKVTAGDNENNLMIEVNVMVVFGPAIPAIIEQTQQHVKTLLEEQTGLRIKAVNINVCGFIQESLPEPGLSQLQLIETAV